MDRKFKGIWIPASLWLSKEFTSQEKIMIAEIDSLDNERGCFASNAYFAEFFNISDRRVRTILSTLAEKGVIKITQKGPKRIIKVEEKFRLRWNEYSGLGGTNVPTYNKVDSKEDNYAPEQAPSKKESASKSKKNVSSMSVEAQLDQICATWSLKKREALELWLQHKRELKSTYKPTGLSRLVNKFNSMEDQMFINTVDFSISQNYQGLFPPKEDKEEERKRLQKIKDDEIAMRSI